MYRVSEDNPTTEKKKQAQFDVSYRRRGKKQIKIRKIHPKIRQLLYQFRQVIQCNLKNIKTIMQLKRKLPDYLTIQEKKGIYNFRRQVYDNAQRKCRNKT